MDLWTHIFEHIGIVAHALTPRKNSAMDAQQSPHPSGALLCYTAVLESASMSLFPGSVVRTLLYDEEW